MDLLVIRGSVCGEQDSVGSCDGGSIRVRLLLSLPDLSLTAFGVYCDVY